MKRRYFFYSILDDELNEDGDDEHWRVRGLSMEMIKRIIRWLHMKCPIFESINRMEVGLNYAIRNLRDACAFSRCVWLIFF